MRPAIQRILIFSGVAFFSAALIAAEAPLASPKLLQALAEEISGELAWKYTALISQYDRVQATEGWHEAAVMIRRELERIGYKDVEIEGWPSNGTTRYSTYRTPIGWRAKKGELWILAPRRERLCSYEELPLTLVKHSHAANVEAELIDVGTGIGEGAYRDKDVKGKIVLATGNPGQIMREAVFQRGALGALIYFAPEIRPGYPNMIRYTAFWPTWEEKDRVGFGFNISKNQGAVLKRMLDEKQKVVLKAEVDAEFYETKIETLSAAYPGAGKPDEEVMIIGHLCHPAPSANDNASGSGGMLEMARALKKMVDKGLVPPPQRTIRFLWVPEFNGTVPYILAHLERTRNTLAVINCDMIGEDLHKTGGTFNVTCAPDSLPSYLNDVVVNFTRAVEALNLTSISGSDNPFAYRVAPFSGGSDHYLFNDGSLRVPSVMFGHGDTFHHTSLDTMDKVDPSELRRVCTVALGAVYYLAAAQDKEAADMARLIARNGLARLAGDYYDDLKALFDAPDEEKLSAALKQVLGVIRWANHREVQSVRSTLRFAAGAPVKAEIESLTGNTKALAAAFDADVKKLVGSLCGKLGLKPKPAVLSDVEKEMSRLYPARAESFICPLQIDYLEEKLGRDVLSQIRLRGNTAYEALNFVNGERSVLEIAQAVSAEYGPQKIEDIYGFFQVLEKAGLLSFKKRI